MGSLALKGNLSRGSREPGVALDNISLDTISLDNISLDTISLDNISRGIKSRGLTRGLEMDIVSEVTGASRGEIMGLVILLSMY
jgi:hypothetical protein